MKFEFEVDFDLSVRHEAEFLDWYENNPSLLKQAVLSGYFVITHGINEYNAQKDDNALADKINRLVQENRELKNMYEGMYSSKISQLRSDYEERINSIINSPQSQKLEEEKQQWIQKYEALSREYTSYIKNTVDSTALLLKQKEIDELKAKLNVFKSTNQYKGAIGEKAVQSVLERNFVGWETRDTSGQTSMSDIHLVDKDGNILAIECKNKASVTLQDIEKSLTDIKTLKARYEDKLIGYLFVSIRSNNIPKKGDLYYELVESVPTIWYGTTELNERELCNMAKLLLSHRGVIKHDIDTSMMLEKVNCYLSKIIENRKQLAAITAAVTGLQSTNDWLYNDMARFVGCAEDVYACAHCDKTFKRKGDLTRHVNGKHS